MGEALVFYALAAVILVTGVLVVTASNMVYSVLFLVVNFLAVGILYVLQRAEFLAVIQILVYAGGIVVLYLFVVMLVNLRQPEAAVDEHRRDRLGLVLGVAVLVELVAIGVYGFGGRSLPVDPQAGGGLANINQIGFQLYVDYLLPFELASVLLLVAMVGAIILAKKDLR